MLLSSNIFSVVLQVVFKNISQHFVYLIRKVLLNKLSKYITYRFKILLVKYPFLYRCVNNFLSAFNFLTYKVLSYIENTLKKETFINYTILYLYSEYLRIMEGKLSLNVFLIITWFVCNLEDYFQLYFILLSFSIFKYYLENNTWIIYNYPKLYKILLELNSLIITGLIIYFLDCILIKVIIPFVKYLWHRLKMESNNNNGNKSTYSDLGKIPGKKPNIEPNEPLLSYGEKRKKKLERQRVSDRNRRTRIAEEQGYKKRDNENLDHLSPEQKKERAREQSRKWRRENKEWISERKRTNYLLKKQAEGKIYKPHKRYEQTSQPVEQASQLVEEASIQTPIYNSGWTAINSGWTAINKKK